MPELPEVEVIRRGVQRWAAQQRISEVEVTHPRAIRRHLPGAEDFRARLRNAVITSVNRRGKYLWLALDTGEALLCHLGMSGQLLITDDDAPVGKHLRVRFEFEEPGHELRFVDQRTFGEMLVDNPANGGPRHIEHIAFDVYNSEFDIASTTARIRKSNRGIKRILLDQTVISGIGNIYADEALWRAQLHGEHPANQLATGQVHDLISHVRAVFDEAITAGGTSFDALYVNTNGESGYFSRSLSAYGRAGQPCRRCHATIVLERFMNRSSHYCPRCQRRPRTRSSPSR